MSDVSKAQAMLSTHDASSILKRKMQLKKVMQEPTADPTRQLRRFNNFQEVEDGNIRYWNERNLGEKMRATAEIIEWAYRQKGIDIHAEGPDRSLVRIQCSWS